MRVLQELLTSLAVGTICTAFIGTAVGGLLFVGYRVHEFYHDLRGDESAEAAKQEGGE